MFLVQRDHHLHTDPYGLLQMHSLKSVPVELIPNMSGKIMQLPSSDPVRHLSQIHPPRRSGGATLSGTAACSWKRAPRSSSKPPEPKERATSVETRPTNRGGPGCEKWESQMQRKQKSTYHDQWQQGRAPRRKRGTFFLLCAVVSVENPFARSTTITGSCI